MTVALCVLALLLLIGTAAVCESFRHLGEMCSRNAQRLADTETRLAKLHTTVCLLETRLSRIEPDESDYDLFISDCDMEDE